MTARVFIIKIIPGSITIKMTAREYNNIIGRDYNNKSDCNGAFQLTNIEITVEANTTREYHNQKDCSGVLQSKVCTESQKQKDCQRIYLTTFLTPTLLF